MAKYEWHWMEQEDAMARYYIQFQNSVGFIAKDDEGEDLPGLEEARAAALVSAPRIRRRQRQGRS
jgi:hypothetical protein